MNSVLPFYYQIMQTVKGWILNKEFNPGEKIPSENELAEKFNVSRLTVRQAISRLIQEGLLNSKRGEGTFVTDNEKLINSFGLEFSGFMDDLFFHQTLKFQIKSVAIKRVFPSKLVKDKLALGNENNEVIEIKRVRFLRDRLFNYIVNYLPLEIGSRITEKDLYKKTLLRILDQDLKIQFTEAIQTIEASFADQEVAEKLGVLSGSTVLFVERIMYTKNQKPVELYHSAYPGDLYKFVFRLKNVERKNGKKWIYQSD